MHLDVLAVSLLWLGCLSSRSIYMPSLPHSFPHHQQKQTAQEIILFIQINLRLVNSLIVNMQLNNIFSLAACLALAQALPTQNFKRTGAIEVVFHGAADAQYTLTVPLDGSSTATSEYPLFPFPWPLELFAVTNRDLQIIP